MKRVIFLFSIFNIQYSTLNIVICQDIHFSQFYQNPLLLNPALTGVIRGDIRATAAHKDQWRSVASPYKTTTFSFDAGLFKKKWDRSYIGAGFQVFSDKAGDIQFATNQLNLSLSSIIYVNENNNLSAGLQGGFAQRSINASNPNIKWDNQYDGSGQNKSIAPNETIGGDAFIYSDFAAGAAWNYETAATTLSSGNQLSANAGAAYYHINRPKQKFQGTDPLHGKLVAHAGAYLGMKNTWLAFLPSALFVMQGSAKEINFGTMARYTIKEESKYTGILKESAVQLGGYYRFGDAFIPAMLFEYSYYAIGISYDVNLSKLRAASSAKGGIEISLRYINPSPFKYTRGTQKSVRFL